MTYKLSFEVKALKAFKKLDAVIRDQLKAKLSERLVNPHVESARLRGDLAGCYKIKLKRSGCRLVYVVIDEQLIVRVVGVGKRDKGEAYLKAKAVL